MELLQNVELQTISLMEESAYGLVQNQAVAARACDLTVTKEGGEQRVVGVLLGCPGDVIGGAPYYTDHHLSQIASFAGFSGDKST
eukprot:3648440-Pleurochrysis_carterae.AAC.1